EYKGWKLQITKKSEKEEAKPNDQQLAECMLKKMAYYEAKMEYEEMTYEYELMKKEWNKEINNVKYTEEENVVKKEYKAERIKLKKALNEKKKIYKQKAKEYKKVKKYDKTDCRILAPDNRRRAQGTEMNMRESFEDVKNQIDKLFERIPRMTSNPK
ncbi:MAG: hypothetical protein IJK97_03000, partial [Thermoguttaceae bacterium]|nr:hypothetical protein [Thermoguttaceae bacterium]